MASPAIPQRRPQGDPLFPYLRTVRAGDRSMEVKQRCDGLGIQGISRHSYRYAWAERALKCGYPERFAQHALGHNSKTVHYAYSKRSEVTVPSLDDCEKQWQKPKVVAVDFAAPRTVGRNVVSSAGAKDTLLAKYDANGNHLWGFMLGDSTDSTNSLKGTSVALDADGEDVMAGAK